MSKAQPDGVPLEDLILRFAHEKPELGQFSVASALSGQGVCVSASTVRNVWKRH